MQLPPFYTYRSTTRLSSHFSICFNKYWYSTSIVPLCTLVHTARGPTPRNHPGMPSVLYSSFRPSTMEAVLNFRGPDFGGDVVEGEDVEIGRSWPCGWVTAGRRELCGVMVLKGRRCNGGGLQVWMVEGVRTWV